MDQPFQRAKCYMPPPHPDLVPRPHLLGLLDAGFGQRHALTLVAAGAGFGKTTLVSSWLSQRHHRHAWLALDSEDNDPLRFAGYLLAALQQIDPAIGQSVAQALQLPRCPPLAALMAVLLDELARLAAPGVLVLDDYHLITDASIHAAVRLLLERHPPQFQLVIITRVDPPLPLPRLRAHRQLTELRTAQLRFQAGEVTVLFNQVMRLSLDAASLGILAERTEGWVAGLHLAAISLREHSDCAAFVRAFAGSHRYVMDYLLDEVLLQQDAAVQAFLLQTCVLERLCGPLCDALLQASGGAQQLLEELERANLFIVPLDDQRRWYRYHHLFADLLRTRLAHLAGKSLPSLAALHQRASRWYAAAGLTADAIGHALAAADWEYAADLLVGVADMLERDGQAGPIQRWIEALPQETLWRRAPLIRLYTQALFCTEQVELAAQRLAADAGPVPADAAAELWLLRACVTFVHEDIQASRSAAQQALALLPSDADASRALALLLIGGCQMLLGELPAACQTLEQSTLLSQRTRVPFLNVAVAYLLSQSQLLLGAISRAAATLEGVRDYRVALFEPMLDLYLGMVAYEQNDLARAAALAENAATSARRMADLPRLIAAQRIRALVYLAYGDTASATAVLAAIDTQLARTPDRSGFVAATVDTLRTRLWLSRGQLAAAAAWLRDRAARDYAASEVDFHLHERWQLHLARVETALGHASRAALRLEPLLEAARTRGSRQIEILVMQALAYAGCAKPTRALAALRTALAHAEPEGFVRLFIDAGPPMRSLLLQLEPTPYVRHLLTHFGPAPALPSATLSERELEVLRLIASGQTNQQIAAALHVAVGTVKRHTSNIFGKLQAQNRTEAVARARELALL